MKRKLTMDYKEWWLKYYLNCTVLGDENPFEVINGSCGYINMMDAIHSWQLVKELSSCLNLPSAASFKHTLYKH